MKTRKPLLALAAAAIFMTAPAAAQTEMDSERIEPLTRQEMKDITTPEREARMVLLEDRINDLNELDPENMTRQERRETRKELRTIQHEMKAHVGGGVYISAGAVIILLLLLILI